MHARRIALIAAGAAALVAGAVVVARSRTNTITVETRAAEIEPRRAPAFAAADWTLPSDVRGSWGRGAIVFAVGAHGAIARLEDPRAGFVAETSGTDRDLNAITGSDHGALVAVGAHGTILQRAFAAGGAWHATPPGFDDDLRAAIVDDDGAVVVGARGRIARAIPDGWATEPSGTTSELRAIARDGAGYVAVGRGGTIVTSPSPRGPWALASSGAARDLHAVAVEGGIAYAFGDGGTLLHRLPGAAWTAEPPLTASSLRSVVHAAGTLYAIAEDGTLLRLGAGRWERSAKAPGLPIVAVAARFDALWSFSGQGVVASLRLF